MFKGKGDRTDPGNYRPISLLNSVSKVFESLVSRQLYNFVETSGVLSEHQFGFRRHRSTVDQLMQLTTTVADSFDRKSYCDGVFLDLAKAFDRADHKVIMSNVSSWCDPLSAAWLHNFISDRRLQVRVGDMLSTSRTLSAGVPQGSHLGPLLFNLSINCLPNVARNSTLTLFADDANLLCAAPSNKSLQSDLDACLLWANQASALFNASKSVHVHFKPASSDFVTSSYSLGSSTLANKTTYRHLGVHLTSSLNFADHIHNITAKFRSRVFLIRHMAKVLPHTATQLLYYSYVRPTVEYATPVWMFGVLASQAEKLERLQASACRAYLTSKNKCAPEWLTPKDRLFAAANWESLCWRRHILGLTYFHHIFYCFPTLLQQFSFVITRNSRRSLSIILPRVGTTMSKSFLFMYALAWNKLTPDLRSIPSTNVFKKKIKAEFVQHKFSTSGLSHLFV